MIDITNRQAFQSLLNQLVETTEAQWGLMRSQHMIEHLTTTLKMSNGKKELPQRYSDEEAKAAKAAFIYTDAEMAKGLKTPTLPEVPGAFEFPTLEIAKEKLIAELDDFENYFKLHPNATNVHPRFGPLNYNEWVILHNKHFLHHFKQFGLV